MFFFGPVFLGDSVLNGILMKSIPVSLAKKFAGQYLLGFSFLIEYTDFVKDKTSLL